ncbi:unnamed protein product [Closterium sp. Yama58-4]|nr:unnamed protein product [Closterium sp. Yama58-4]
MSLTNLPPSLNDISNQLSRSFTQLKTTFSKIDKCEDPSRQSQLLEDVTPKLRECRRLIQEFERDMKDQEAKNSPEVNKLLQEKKRTLVKDLNAFVTLKKTYQSAIQEGQKVKLSEDGRTAEVVGAPRLASAMTNAQLMEEGNRVMGQMDQSVLRSKQVVENTINIGAATATTLKGQTEQMERIVDKLDNLEFSLKRTTKLVKALGRQMATDKCILAMLALVILGVIAIIIVKIVDPHNKKLSDFGPRAPSTSN